MDSSLMLCKDWNHINLNTLKITLSAL